MPVHVLLALLPSLKRAIGLNACVLGVIRPLHAINNNFGFSGPLSVSCSKFVLVSTLAFRVRVVDCGGTILFANCQDQLLPCSACWREVRVMLSWSWLHHIRQSLVGLVVVVRNWVSVSLAVSFLNGFAAIVCCSRWRYLSLMLVTVRLSMERHMERQGKLGVHVACAASLLSHSCFRSAQLLRCPLQSSYCTRCPGTSRLW